MAFIPPKPVPKGLWRRTPPAIFPPILGLLGLGLAWRRGAADFGVPGEVVELALGGLTLLALYAALAYAGKFVRRLAVLSDDLRILPGYAGVAAALLCLEQLVSVIAPYAPVSALLLFWTVLALHVGLLGQLVLLLARAPAQQRRVTPAWHLPWSGLGVTALAAQHIGLATLALWLFWLALGLSVLIWAACAEQFRRERMPAPLRPLHAIHLAPMAYMGALAVEMGLTGTANALAVLSGAFALVLLAGARWLLAGGFSPLWSALTFPTASVAGFWLMHGGRAHLAGDLMLVLATLLTFPIAFAVLRDWASGRLAIKTGAAVA
ncbi:MAG: tellurium resistance protein [Rhodobacteraceae bacterium]|nr:tellurium resistance protein [Paracoccaceae bacterium]